MALPLVVATLILTLWVPFAHADNTTCIDSQLDWYTAVVGESPCATYQRLRQICNDDYEVPAFNRHTVPGDSCDDPNSVCCCNTIAFQLSMLCMNCQYDATGGSSNGINAPLNAYKMYQHGCRPETDNLLPNATQAAVCNENIRLDDFLYSSLGFQGSWSYAETQETAEQDHTANSNNTFRHCPNQISPSSTPTPTSNSVGSSEAMTTGTSQSSTVVSSGSATQTPVGNHNGSKHGNFEGNTGSHVSIGVLVGVVVGGVGVLALAGACVIFYCMRRKRTARALDTQNRHSSRMTQSKWGSPTGSATPFVAGTMAGGLGAPPVSATLAQVSFAGPERRTEPPRAYSPNPSMNPPHNEDSGSSERRPPVYHWWKKDDDTTVSHAGSNFEAASTLEGQQNLELWAAATQPPLVA